MNEKLNILFSEDLEVEPGVGLPDWYESVEHNFM